jgi:hypothetical protein
MLEGENTLRRGQCCIVFKGPMFELQHVIIRRIFTMCFAYYGRSKPKEVKYQRKIKNSIWCDVRVHLCKKKKCHNILKNANIYNKWLKLFLIFIKFVQYLLNIVISYYWNKFMNNMKSLIIIISEMGFF